METRGMHLRAITAVGALALLAAACGGGSSAGKASPGGGSSSSSSASTVAIDVGNGMTVHLTKAKLHIGVFIPGLANEYSKQLWDGVQAGAKQIGATVTLYNSNYSATTQLNQAQTALQSAHLDAAFVHPNDGTVVCNVFTKQYPQHNILVVNSIVPLCDRGTAQTGSSPDELWAPGTMSFVGSNNYLGYIEKWFEAAANANPGKQKAVVVLGPQTAGQTQVVLKALNAFKAKNSDFQIADTIFSDYTAPGAFKQMQSYLTAHNNITVVMSIYSPDMTQGILRAMKADGKTNLKLVDQGGSKFSVDEIKAGVVQLTMAYFPYTSAVKAIVALGQAQQGNTPPRFVDDSTKGTAQDPFIITKSNVDSFKPED
jgi:ABC-type sugar transport system substrate-binding protein